MKKLYYTEIQKKYVLTLYKLTKYYTKEVIYNNYKNEYTYEVLEVIHGGCYKKTFSYEFNSDNKLREYLKSYYKGYNYVSLYSSLKNAMKDRSYNNFIMVLKEIGTNNEEDFKITLKNKKKKKNRRRTYYCDCFKCVGTTYKMKNKINKSDEKRLEKNEVFSN